jgi:hypothetical protein
MEEINALLPKKKKERLAALRNLSDKMNDSKF